MKVGDIITLKKEVRSRNDFAIFWDEDIDHEIIAIVDNAVCVKIKGYEAGLKWMDKRILQKEIDGKKANDSGVEVEEI